MNALLPGVTNIIERLTPERLAAVVEDSYIGREVIVQIPKFTIERSLPLRPVSCNLLFVATSYIPYLLNTLHHCVTKQCARMSKIIIVTKGTFYFINA